VLGIQWAFKKIGAGLLSRSKAETAVKEKNGDSKLTTDIDGDKIVRNEEKENKKQA
jgi:hypothetical protein